MALAANALTDYATVASELGLAGSTDQALVERLINVASGLLEKFTNRQLSYAAAWLEKTACYGTPILLLKRVPLVSIASISLDAGASTLDPTEYAIQDAEAGFVFRAIGWPSTGLLKPDLNFQRQVMPGTEEARCWATYAGGYLTGPQVAGGGAFAGQTRTLPYDLEEAAVVAVRAFYRERRDDPNTKSESVLGQLVSFDRQALPAIAQGLAAPFRRIV